MTDTCFSHVALLVNSADTTLGHLNKLGIEGEEPMSFESEGTRESYIGNYDQNSGLLLLMEATGEGPYLKALKKRGPGLHHIAIDVVDRKSLLLSACQAGWSIHPAFDPEDESVATWLYKKDLPSLIEVQKAPKLSSKAQLVRKIGLPLSKEQLKLFEVLGLSSLVFSNEETQLTLEQQNFSFREINP